MQMTKEVLVGFLTLCGGFLGFWGMQNNTYINEKNILLDRLEKLETKFNLSNEEKLQLQLDLIKLNTALNNKVTKTKILERFIDAIPRPIWIKIYEGNGEFRNILINKAYEDRFNITKAAYQGKLDSEIWPKNVADKLKESDLKVIKNKNFIMDVVESIANSVRTKAIAYKFYIKINSKQAVGGIIACDLERDILTGRVDFKNYCDHNDIPVDIYGD